MFSECAHEQWRSQLVFVAQEYFYKYDLLAWPPKTGFLVSIRSMSGTAEGILKRIRNLGPLYFKAEWIKSLLAPTI